MPYGKYGVFQYISDDSTQLYSQVIKVFEREFDSEKTLDIEEVILCPAAFYAHVFLSLGVRQKIWRKIGSAAVPTSNRVIFRNTEDYGKGIVPVSKRWYVWRSGEPFKHVGELSTTYQSAEIGVVVPPDSVVYRKQHGEYDFVYPGF